MRTRILLVLALVGAIAAAAVVRRPGASDPFPARIVAELLRRPVDDANLTAEERANPPRSLFDALLSHPATTPTADGVTLRLGRVVADPTVARASAHAAGELLALEAVGPDGPLGKPLWRAVLDGPALERGAETRTLRLYGCRHSADADAAPALEDTYYARLALARALAGHAATQPGEPPLALAGEHVPVKSGVNFEVQLAGSRQTLVVTFDGRPDLPALHATRDFVRPATPQDARARARLVQALEAAAAAHEPPLVLAIAGADAPVAGGLDVRLEDFGERVTLVALAQGRRLSSWAPSAAQAQGE